MADTKLSVKEFEALKAAAIDPEPRGRVIRAGMNANLSDEELIATIKKRNTQRKPVYLLLVEYENRLEKLGLL